MSVIAIFCAGPQGLARAEQASAPNPNLAGRLVGDPSVWWHEGALIREWESFDTSRAVGKPVAILVGTKPRPANRPLPFEPVITNQNGRQIDLRNVAGEMADSLRQGGVKVSYQSFAEYGHGDMMRVSLERALHIASEP